MTPDDDHLHGKLEHFRREFDRSFAAPARSGERAGEALLLLRIGKDPVAVRVSEIAGLLPLRGLVPVPSRSAELLGVAGVRGALVPVFSLARFVGYGCDSDPPRWVLLCGPGPIGFAVGSFERHIRVPEAALQHASESDPRSPHVTQLLTVGDVTCPVISIPSMVRALSERQDKESPP